MKCNEHYSLTARGIDLWVSSLKREHFPENGLSE